MVIRFTDNVLENIEGTDFVVRRRVPRAAQIIIAFCIGFILIFLSYSSTEEWKLRPLFTTTLTLVISTLGIGACFAILSARKLSMSAEFQNAMFASAARIGSRFCLVAHKNGTIAYIDQGFQTFFPHFSAGDSRTINSLLVYANIPEGLAHKIVSIMQKNTSDSVILEIKDEDGKGMELFVTIDPITRPKGYFIIRGRNFIKKREEDEEAIRERKMMYNNYNILFNALHGFPGALAVAGKRNEIILVSHEMEHILGYRTGEMVKSAMVLEDIFATYPGRDSMADYEGNAVLTRSNNTEYAVKLKQKVLLGEAGRKIGVRIQLTEY